MLISRVSIIEGKKIVISCSKDLTEQADWLLGVIDNMSKSGVVIDDGVRIQIGWSMLIFRLQPDKSLFIFEPDFANDPFKDEVFDISITLKYLALQNDFAARVGVTPVLTSFQDKIVIEKNCLESERIYLSRVSPSPEKGDSGWFIGKQGLNQESAELVGIYTFQLLKLRPELMFVLALPEGFMVMLNGENVEAVLNPNDEVVNYQ